MQLQDIIRSHFMHYFDWDYFKLLAEELEEFFDVLKRDWAS